MHEQMSFDLQNDPPPPVSPIIAELNSVGITSIEEGLQYVREALLLSTAMYNAAIADLTVKERLDVTAGRTPRDYQKAEQRRWKRIKEHGLPFFCFQKLQDVSEATRNFLLSEFKLRFQHKEIL